MMIFPRSVKTDEREPLLQRMGEMCLRKPSSHTLVQIISLH